MPTYELRLESPVDSQYKKVALEAPTAEEANAGALRLEDRHVNYSLLPPDEQTWLKPPGSTEDDPDGLVDMRRWDYEGRDGGWTDWAAGLSYKGAVNAATERLERLTSGAKVVDGKIVAPGMHRRQRALLAAHHQAEPYAIVDTRVVTPEELAAGEEAVAGAIRMRDLARSLKAAPPAGIDPTTWVKVEELLRQGGVPMAAVTAVLLGPAWLVQITGTTGSTVFSSGTLKMMLMASYTVDQDAHDFANDFTTEISNGNGYVTGGYTFANKAQSYDTASDQVRVDNTVDPNWTSSTISPTDAGIYVAKGGASSADPALAAIDFGGTVSTTNGTLTVALDATGWASFDLT